MISFSRHKRTKLFPNPGPACRKWGRVAGRDPWQDLVLRQVLVPLARFMQSTRCPADTHLLEVRPFGPRHPLVPLFTTAWIPSVRS